MADNFTERRKQNKTKKKDIKNVELCKYICGFSRT